MCCGLEFIKHLPRHSLFITTLWKEYVLIASTHWVLTGPGIMLSAWNAFSHLVCTTAYDVSPYFSPLYRAEHQGSKPLGHLPKVTQLESEEPEKYFHIPPSDLTHLLHTRASTCRGRPHHAWAEHATEPDRSPFSILELKKAGLAGHFIMFPGHKNLELNLGGSIVQTGHKIIIIYKQ